MQLQEILSSLPGYVQLGYRHGGQTAWYTHLCEYGIMTVWITETSQFETKSPCPPLESHTEFWYTTTSWYQQKRFLKARSKIDPLSDHLPICLSKVLSKTHLFSHGLVNSHHQVTVHFGAPTPVSTNPCAKKDYHFAIRGTGISKPDKNHDLPF